MQLGQMQQNLSPKCQLELYRINPIGVAEPTVNLDLSTDRGASWNTIAAEVAVDPYGRGVATWIAGPETDDRTALIRANANLGGTVFDTSHEAFRITHDGNIYYVNDVSTADDEFTVAPGDNANSGKSPATPVADLSNLLLQYNLDPGDIIFIDNGSYHLLNDLRIES